MACRSLANRYRRDAERQKNSAVSIECAEVQFYIVPPTPETMMLARTESATPAGRLALFAERSAAAARRWLERTA